MNRRGLIFAGLFILIFILTFTQRGMLGRLIAVPLLTLWWQVKLYYAGISQPAVWAALVALIGTSAIVTILPAIRFGETEKIKTKTAQGSIETLANLLEDAKQGPYFDKWLIANRLGENAGEILAQREGRPVNKTFGALSGSGWNPPPEIGIYLDTGLQSSLTGRTDRRWSLHGKSHPPTPLDIDLQQVVDYLENEMKM
jgi:hypothetical protein